MAVITGRYGAVEIALPGNVPVVENGVSNYTSIWGGSTFTPNAYASGADTLDSVPGLQGKKDSNGNVDKHELWIPQGDSLKAQGPKIVSSITTWSLENTINPIEYAASNTRGYKGKLAGLHDATGNIAGLGAIPPLAPGQRFRFYGFTGPKNGVVDNTDGIVYSITAIVNTVQIQVSYQWNSPITWTVGWQADWQQPGDELAISKEGFWDYTSIPCCELLPSKEVNLEIYAEGADDTSGEILSDLCLLDANIQFTNETAQYANSCSARAGGWQSRLAGPTTCSVSTNIQGDDFTKTGDLYPGSNHLVRMFVGGDGDNCPLTCWEFKKLFFTGFSGLNIDTTSNTPLQFSCNMDFNAYDENCNPGWIRFCDNVGKEQDGTSWKPAPIDEDCWQYLVNLDPDKQ